MRFSGTSGDDNLIGTGGKDRFNLRHGGVDSVVANGGDDVVHVYQDLEVGSRFDGGGGYDTLFFQGDLPDGFTFTGGNLANFEVVAFFGHGSASIAAECNPIGHELFVSIRDGNDIDASMVAGYIDAFVTGQASFRSGLGNDQIDGGSGTQYLDGGAGNDSIDGTEGDDVLTGGGGADQFEYYLVYDPGYQLGHDTITDFNVSEDVILIASQDLLRFSQLEFVKDGHGGTIVQFDAARAVDLEHVARSTLSKSNFTFYDPPSQTPACTTSVIHAAFDLHSHTGPTMFGLRASFGDFHPMEHAALV